MSPRAYKMGKRAAAVAETKRRILEAALAEYAETGIAEASMQSVARRADVAPGTVLYHFPDPAALADAVLDERASKMHVPDPATVAGAGDLHARVRLLTAELFRIYHDTDLDYRVWMRSREHPAMTRVEAWYNERYAAVLAAALGEAADPRAFQVSSALIDPGFRAGLEMRGLSADEAVDETVALLMAWLRGRDPEASSGAASHPSP